MTDIFVLVESFQRNRSLFAKIFQLLRCLFSLDDLCVCVFVCTSCQTQPLKKTFLDRISAATFDSLNNPNTPRRGLL